MGGSLYPATGTQSVSNAVAAIDYSNQNEGYVYGTYFGPESQKCKIRITHISSGGSFYFSAFSGKPAVFPLTYGDGEYNIEIMQQTSGNSYRCVLSQRLTVILRDKLLPNLYPNTYVNYTAASQCVKKARELTAGITSNDVASKILYSWIESNIKYDTEQAKRLVEQTDGAHWFVPDPDLVLTEGKSICFGYASLLAAMHRCIGIPCRISIGRVKNGGRHAWNEIYWENEGFLNSRLRIPAKQFKLVDITFDVSANDAQIASWVDDPQNYMTEYRG